MNILVAEFAVGTGLTGPIFFEGRAMLNTLVRSFRRIGHTVITPTGDFERGIVGASKDCDAGLIIAPDDVLPEFTRIIEDNTVNLGCSSSVVRLCADKLRTSERLSRAGVSVPRIDPDDCPRYVIKPRYGCASEDVFVVSDFVQKEGCITTEFIGGEHLSVSLIIGSSALPLTVNKQLVEIDHKIQYVGGVVPHRIPRWKEVINTAVKSAQILSCKGYMGVDIVLDDKPYVVDVNPRPTTSIVGVSRVVDREIADLILRARFSELPDDVQINGSYSFTKGELEAL